MVIGFLSGLLGVGGGFLTTSILMMIGIPPIVAAASDTNAVVATSASGVAAHFRLRNVDFKMWAYCLLGGLFGSALGVHAVKLLGARGYVDLLISVMYVVILGGIGGFMVYSSIGKLRRGVLTPRERPAKSSVFTTVLTRLPFQAEFARSGVRHSILLPFALCSLVGIMTAFMGVGGGFMMVPVMVYLLACRRTWRWEPPCFKSCLPVWAASNHSVDLVLALVIAAGSTIGAQLGARLSKHLRGEQLLIVLGVLALAVGLKMAVGIALRPSNPLTQSGAQAVLRADHNLVLPLARAIVRSPLSH